MTLTNVLTMIAACMAGFLGGPWRREHRYRPRVRASRFQLVDSAGRTVARWGTDATTNGVRLQLLGEKGLVGLDLGAGPDGPSFEMYGPDGKERISMSLGPRGHPGLLMSDERWLGRIVLGQFLSDTPDIPSNVDRWGLKFSPFGTTLPAALIGMTNGGARKRKESSW